MQFRPLDEVVKEIYIRAAEEQGREQGREEGREQGREEEREQVARSMLADGLPAEVIRKYTGLEEERICAIR